MEMFKYGTSCFSTRNWFFLVHNYQNITIKMVVYSFSLSKIGLLMGSHIIFGMDSHIIFGSNQNDVATF